MAPLRLSRSGLVLALILAVAAFLRFYDLRAAASFGGEQGRDLLVAKEILDLEKFTLLGPATSLSDRIHFGPFYHYYNAFWLAVFRADPFGPVFGFAVLNLFACFALYRLGKLWLTERGGLAAAAIFAASPLMVRFSRAMFNSYFVVALTILALWALAAYRSRGKLPALVIGGLLAGLAVQANFLAFSLLPAALAWLWLNPEKSNRRREVVVFSASFLAACLPYLLFEVRHDFFNLRGFWDWLGASGPDSGRTQPVIGWALFGAFYYSVGLENFLATGMILAAVAAMVGYAIRPRWRSALPWLLPGLILVFGPELYPGDWAPHYLGGVYPVVFLLFGFIVARTNGFNRFTVLGWVFFGLVVGGNLFRSLTFLGAAENPHTNMNLVKKAAKIISKDAAGNFNIANLLEGDTRGHAFRYLLRLEGKEPLGVEVYPATAVLYVVSPQETAILDYPVWEITSLLPAEVVQVWPVDAGVYVYKLVRQ